MKIWSERTAAHPYQQFLRVPSPPPPETDIVETLICITPLFAISAHLVISIFC